MNFSTPPKGLIPLLTAAAANSSVIDFTSGLISSYSAIDVIFDNLVFDTNTVNFLCTVSRDGGATQITTGYSGGHTKVKGGTDGGTSSGGVNGTSSIVMTASTLDNSVANHNLNGRFTLYNPAGTANFHSCDYAVSYYNGTQAEWSNGFCRIADAATAINAMRFKPSGGLIVSGNISMFGRTTP